MAHVLEENVVFHCTVETIAHPNAKEEGTRVSKSAELWTVFKTYVKNGSKYEPKTCVGMAPHLDVGDKLTLTGDWVDAGAYGVQFRFNGLQKMVPADRNSLVVFFTRNVDGVGQKTAEKIVNALGVTAVEDIENDTSILVSKVGLTPAKANDIAAKLCAIHSSIDEMKFFAKTGLGPARIAMVKQQYNEKIKEDPNFNLIDFITENPYRLIEDVKNIGFKLADGVALSLGFSDTDPKRIAAGIKYALKDNFDTKGNIWETRDKTISTAAGKNFLNIQMCDVEPILNQLIQIGELYEENNRVYLPLYYNLEKKLADQIHDIQNYKNVVYDNRKIDNGIERAQKAKGRTLDAGQIAAVKACINSNVSIITGGPGTGKTTTLDTLLYFLEQECRMTITMCAPTGRAAKRMTEQTQRPAHTIHALSVRKKASDFCEEKGHRHVIVIDESSMVDINIMKMILDMCHISTKLIMVGDVDQLPSIGPGQILRDMIESESITTARLTTIHRQSSDSNIITNAHAIIEGKKLGETFAPDFFVSEQETEELCIAMLKKLVCKHYPERLNINPSDIQVLAPLKKGALGVTNLNKMMQEWLNPPAPYKRELNMNSLEFGMILREGDRVIQMKNDYELPLEDGTTGVYNGEIGKIETISTLDGEAQICVNFGDKVALYDSKTVKNLNLAYAITVHKSQGSEFKVVIIPLFTYMMPTIYNRNLLYTAVTRAKEYCCILGQMATVNKMIRNNTINRRQTTFAIRLNGKSDDFLLSVKANKKKSTTKKSTTKTTTKKTTTRKTTKKKTEET